MVASLRLWMIGATLGGEGTCEVKPPNSLGLRIGWEAGCLNTGRSSCGPGGYSSRCRLKRMSETVMRRQTTSIPLLTRLSDRLRSSSSIIAVSLRPFICCSNECTSSSCFRLVSRRYRFSISRWSTYCQGERSAQVHKRSAQTLKHTTHPRFDVRGIPLPALTFLQQGIVLFHKLR